LISIVATSRRNKAKCRPSELEYLHDFRLNLKSLSGSEGRIRLSEDEGPSAAEFLGDGDDYDDDNLHLSHSDTDTLSEQMKRATRAWREPNITPLYSKQNATTPTAPPASGDNVIRL
jgi:hypothetical protein